MTKKNCKSCCAGAHGAVETRARPFARMTRVLMRSESIKKSQFFLRFLGLAIKCNGAGLKRLGMEKLIYICVSLALQMSSNLFFVLQVILWRRPPHQRTKYERHELFFSQFQDSDQIKCFILVKCIFIEYIMYVQFSPKAVAFIRQVSHVTKTCCLN